MELDDLLLLPVDPARQTDEEELPRAKDEIHVDSDTEDWIDLRGDSGQLERRTRLGNSAEIEGKYCQLVQKTQWFSVWLSFLTIRPLAITGVGFQLK